MEKAVTDVPFSRLAAEQERKITVAPEDLRLIYLTNGLINRAVKTRASLVVSRGFELTYSDDRVKNCITKFLDNIQKNDLHGLNLEMMMEQMCKDTDVFGNGFRLLVENKSKSNFVALKPLHPVNVDFKRDPMGKIDLDESRNPTAYVVKLDTGQKIEVERDKMAHLAFDVLGDEVVGQSLVVSVYNQIERLQNIEEGLAQAIYKKGWPLHEAILTNRPDWTPDETDIEYVNKQLDGIDAASHFTHTDDYRLVVHDAKFPLNAMNYPVYYVDQICSVTGIPKYILLGDESANTRATAESLQRVLGPLLKPLQERLKVMIENQIFKRVLEKENLSNGWCHVEWNEILPEQDDTIAEKINILASTLVEGKPILKNKEAREMLHLPAIEEGELVSETMLASSPLALSSGLGSAPKTVAGIYLTPPHGQLIWQGRKKAIVKSVKFDKHVGEPLALVSGNYIWGKIRLDSPTEIDDKQFQDLFKKHYITEEEKKSWWPEKKILFYYPLQVLEVFKTPKFYNVPQGVQTFIDKLQV
jgi:hypothetical protein